MMLISGVNTDVIQPVTATGEVLGASRVQKPEEELQGRQPKPVMDEYVPEKPQEPSGRYWMGKDADGQPKIYFDDPDRTASAPKQPDDPEEEQGAKGPENKDGKEEICEGSTDKVDREIERLKKKRQELEQRLSTESDSAKIKELERQLAQVERELRQKDNDTYRRQHTQVTRLS